MESNNQNYIIKEKIHDGVHTFVYKGYRKKDNIPVIIKSLKTEYPTTQQVAKLKYEYNMIKDLDIDGIIKFYEIVRVNNLHSIIMEDIQGISLDIIIEKESNPELDVFLQFAIKLTKSVEGLHKHNIIHKDIKSLNIIVNKETEEQRLIDFGISSSVNKKSETAPSETTLDGTLAYISPEQTGRTNQKIDFRSDLYSMGITFYEYLTGQLPFKSTDAIELVHAHIAVIPEPPHKIREDIPPVISEIILKLLSKNPDERYQSAHGLIVDLEECLKQFENKGKTDTFKIASHDISTELRIPQKIYGRSKEKAKMENLYQKVCQEQSNIALITGYMGIGKTTLAEVLKEKTIAPDNNTKASYFITGVYDRYRRNIPYHGLIDAIDMLIKKILTNSDDNIENCKQKIIKAIEPNGIVLTKVIPYLKHLIGEQPQVEELGPEESQNRFNLVFQNFIKVFTDNPLIILLDDLQYIDIASVKLIEKIMTDPAIKKLLIIGAYRENDVDKDHPLNTLEKNLKEFENHINKIKLMPLSEESIKELISDTLAFKNDKADELTNIILNKTNGNPFFIKHFLNNIYEEGFLIFDTEKELWTYKLDKIQDISITDNVAELMTRKIESQPKETIRILKLAGCIGVTFHLNTLSAINEKSEVETADDLRSAIDSGLIIPMTEDYLHPNNENDISYKFLHPLVQSASYELNTKEEKQNNHLAIGRYMLKTIQEEDIENNIFDMLNQLNASRKLITHKEEIKRLIELNIQASEKSQKSSAFDAAMEYSSTALEILPKDYWENEYELTLKLYRTYADTLNYTYKYDEAEKVYKDIMPKTKNIVDKLVLYEEYSMLENNRENYTKTLELCKEGLKLVDIDIPSDKEELIKLIEEEDKILQKKINDRTPQQIAELPPLEDKQTEAIINNLRVFSGLGNKMSNKYLEHISVVKIMNLILDNGTPKDSAGYFIYYSVYLKDIGDNDKAYEWGKMCVDIVDKENNPRVMAKVYSEFANSISAIKTGNKKENLKYYDKALKAYMDIGETSASCIIVGNKLISKFVRLGENLKDIFIEIRDGLNFVRRFKNTMIESLITVLFRIVGNLLGLTESYDSLDGEIEGEDFTEDGFAKMLMEKKLYIGLIWLYDLKLRTLCIYEEFEKIIDFIEGFEKKGENLNIAKKFYNFFSITQLYDTFDEEQQKEKLVKLEDTIKNWDELSKGKRNNNTALMDAEFAKINNNFKEACKYYDESIKMAMEKDLIMDVAFACECAARFYKKHGMDFIAKAYYTEAYYAYRSWGAEGKTQQMRDKYHNEINFKSEITTSPTDTKATISITPNGENMGDILDVSTVIKSSQAISGEIVLNRLLKKLMGIVIENAGAQKGYLILKRDNNLTIEAEGNIDKNEIKITESIPVAGSGLVAESIINYVCRTMEDVVLKDASSEESYNKDPYIINHTPKSIMSIPLINQGNLTGLLYLENNLGIGIFTKDRLEILKMLSGQMAISIENSLLYYKLEEYNKTLEQKVDQRTNELSQALEEVTKLKIQQDGDYYLTSLLIKPLIVNKSHSPNITTEFILQQKKKFTFKDWNAELGGDLCITHTITLNNELGLKTYTVFVNADAMGKSIQGAGGSLVLGVVFNALVSRTKFVPGASNLSPEEWLIRCYRELQDVFVSFDGSMLISAIVGIADDETGMVYYFNAEHPYTILYRNGKARFIEKEILNHKIGWTLGREKVMIKSIHLKSGDVILAGSDGKDDIYIDVDDSKRQIVNHDETLILRSIEKTNANLKSIIEDIKSNGEIMDDISLIKISYKSDNQSEETHIPEEYYKNRDEGFNSYSNGDMESASQYLKEALKMYESLECFKKLINTYIKMNNTTEALNVVEQALKKYSGDLHIIFQASVLYKRNSQFDKAIYFGKRFYIHNPNDITNIINLADSYRYTGNVHKAIKTLKEAEKIDPDNVKVKKLYDLINNQS